MPFQVCSRSPGVMSPAPRSGCRRARVRTPRLPLRTRRRLRADDGWGRSRRPRLDDANGRKRAEVAVEVAALGHRVDVRAEQDRRKRRLEAFAAREDVAGGIDPRLEAGRAHQAHHVGAAGDIRVRIRHAAHPIDERTASRAPVLTELFEPRASAAASTRRSGAGAEGDVAEGDVADGEVADDEDV